MKKRALLGLAIVIIMSVFTVIGCFAGEGRINIGDTALEGAKDELISAASVLGGWAKGDIVLAPDVFGKNCLSKDLGGGSAVSCDLSLEGLSAGDILVLQFKGECTDGNGAYMDVVCAGISNRVFLTETPAMYYIPVSGLNSLSGISFAVPDASDISIDSVYLVNYHSNYNISELKTGQYCMDNRKTVTLTPEDRLISSSSQCLVKDGIIYSIYNGTLTAYNYDGSVCTALSKVSGLGTTRDMVFVKDKTAIAVSSRQSGVYFVDISDPRNMFKISHYDPLEAVTGIYADGNYLFLCSRYFGVEFVDISDLKNPAYINKVSCNSEYQDCFVKDGILYVGVYKNKRVDIYNVSDLNNPVLLSQLSLDGNGQGVYVEDGLLYAATALNSQNDSSKMWSYGKGSGNGMEIYDVSNPSAPVHISTVKTDGRLYINTSDVWDIQVSQGYAYLTDMYNGVYVYNVKNPYNPVCEYRFQVEAASGSSFYQSFDTGKFVFPWNAGKVSKGSAWHVSVQNGEIYAAMTNFGVCRFECEKAAEIKPGEPFAYTIGTAKNDQPVLNGYDSASYKSEGCVWAAAEKDSKIYLAAGESGIEVLDSSLKLVQKIECDYSVKDVKISGEYLFAAESEGGVGIYRLGDTVEKVGCYPCTSVNYSISQIALTGDGKYAVAQTSLTTYLIIDVRTPSKPVRAAIGNDVGSMYYRNICTGLANGKYVGIFGSKKIKWFYSDGDTLSNLEPVANSFYSESGGMTSAGDRCVAVCGKGYKYFDPDSNYISQRILVPGAELYGKCSSDGKLLVVSTSYDGTVTIVDISDINSPKLVERFSVPGNPDVALILEDHILIPCRNQGLLKLSKKKLSLT